MLLYFIIIQSGAHKRRFVRRCASARAVSGSKLGRNYKINLLVRRVYRGQQTTGSFLLDKRAQREISLTELWAMAGGTCSLKWV
jgi:hypothetical protein